MDPDSNLPGLDTPFERGDPFQPHAALVPIPVEPWVEMTSEPENTLAFQPVPNTLQIDMLYLWQGQVMENVFHVYRSAGWAGQSLAFVADIFRLWQSNHLRTTQAAGCILNEIIVRDLTSSSGSRADVAVTADNGGTIINGPEAANVSFAIKWNTSNGGRNASGRTFFIGMIEGWVQDSIVDQNAANLILEKFNTLIPLVNVNGQRLVVVSRYLNKVKRPSGVVYGILNASYTDRVVDSMRRRLPGRGR